VPNSRSIAGGPQIFAPMDKYARISFGGAVVAGAVDPGLLIASSCPQAGFTVAGYSERWMRHSPPFRPNEMLVP